MAKVKVSEADLTFTPLQKTIFDEFSKNPKLVKKFHFTGGTALSAVYLHHRDSEDLDFFAEQGFDNLIIEQFVNEVAKQNDLGVRSTEVYSTRIFNLVDKNSEPVIKIDFNYYPYDRVKEGIVVNGVEIDSKEDIAINKLMTIVDRFEVKDYVDLYFLLREFSLERLIKGVKKKFNQEIDLILLASNFLRAEEFEMLPRMLTRLTIFDLKEYFREEAKKLGKRITKK